MPSRVLDSYGTTIFEVMSALAREHDAINLGQGFPDGNGPADLRQVAAEALEGRPKQYPPMIGVPELRQAVSGHARRFYGLELDPDTEVLVTSGATEALAACFFGLLNPGDEVVLFEPVYDSYVPILELIGAVPRFVRLVAPDWTVDEDELAAAFGDRTRMVVLNSPMNPTGKVFTAAELDLIARHVMERQAVAVCDEVYEHLVFDGLSHIPLMTRPGMAERCVRIGSAGKTFSLTGWKVGYVGAAAPLRAAVARAHQYLTFTTPPNLQRAVAVGLGKHDSYFEQLRSDMQARRDRLRAALLELGFGVASCQGTYFLGAEFSALRPDVSDVELCRAMTIEGGVAAVPISAFYRNPPASQVVRFCFCKDPATLDAAIHRLREYFRR